MKPTLLFLLLTVSAFAADVTLQPGDPETFGASVLDQFAQPMITPPVISWTATGGTLSSSSGASTTYTAGQTQGTYTITANSGSLSASRSIEILPADPTFATWIAANHPTLTGTDAAATADPDADGLPNLLEYALGGDPTAAASQPNLKSLISDLKLQLEFTPKVLTGLSYTIQASSDLSSWADTDVTPQLSLNVPFTFTDPIPADASNPSRFLRLKITE